MLETVRLFSKHVHHGSHIVWLTNFPDFSSILSHFPVFFQCSIFTYMDELKIIEKIRITEFFFLKRYRIPVVPVCSKFPDFSITRKCSPRFSSRCGNNAHAQQLIRVLISVSTSLVHECWGASVCLSVCLSVLIPHRNVCFYSASFYKTIQGLIS